MAKKKAKTPPLTSQKVVSLLVPDAIGNVSPDSIKSLAHVVAHAGDLSLGKKPHVVQHVAIIKTSKVADQVKNLPADWMKSIVDGC